MLVERRVTILGCVCICLVISCDPATLSTSGHNGDDPGSVSGTPTDRLRPGATDPDREPETPLIPITITEPLDGSLLGQPRVRVSGTAEGLETVAVNGQSTEVEDGLFSVFVLLDEGIAVIEATGAHAEPDSVEVLIDLTPPVLVITTPDRGYFSIEGEEVLVAGETYDELSAVVRVAVNGGPVFLWGRAFDFDLTPEPGLNLIEIEAEDAAGNIAHATRCLISGNYSAVETPSRDALGAFVREDVFPMIEEMAVPILEDQISAALGGLGGGGDVEIRSVTYSSILLDMAPDWGFIYTNLKMYNLRIEVRVTFEVLWWDVSVSGSVSADPADVTIRIIPTVGADGSLGITLSNGDVNLNNFRFDISGIPGFIERLLFGLVGDIAEDLISDALRSFVLEDLFDPSSLLRTIDLLGTTLEFNLLVTEIPITPAGVSLWANALVLGEVIHAGPGSLMLPGELTELPSDRTFNLAVAYNFINQLFNALWGAGALDLDLAALLAGTSTPIPLNVAGFSLFVGEEILTHFPPNAPVVLDARPLLPPVAMPEFDPEIGIMGLGIGDMLLDLSVEHEDGTRERFATAAIYIDMGIDLAWIDGGLVPSIALRAVVDTDDEPIFDIDDDAFESNLADLMAMIPDLVAGGLDEFGLAGFEGFELTNMTFRSLEKAPYLVIGADLNIVPPTETP